MKTNYVTITCFLVSILFATPSLAKEKRGKIIHDFNPGPNAYEQISEKDALKTKNHFRSNQYQISIKPEVSPKKPADKDTDND